MGKQNINDLNSVKWKNISVACRCTNFGNDIARGKSILPKSHRSPRDGDPEFGRGF